MFITTAVFPITDSSATTVWRSQENHERRTSFLLRVSTFLSCYTCTVSATELTKRVCVRSGLQTTRLGSYIEDRVNKYLKRQNHPEAGEVFVRVVASSDKTVEVKPGMKSRYRHLPLTYWNMSLYLNDRMDNLILYHIIFLQVCWIGGDVRNLSLQNQSTFCIRGDWRSGCVFLWHACPGVWIRLSFSQHQVVLCTNTDLLGSKQ